MTTNKSIKHFTNKIIAGEAGNLIKELPSNCIDLILTDPPYFLDKMDNNWKHKTVSSKENQYVIKSLPAGMKFDKNQGQKFYDWYSGISRELFRVLKPGGFFFSFSSPRLYHKMASAIDDAGFEIRDCFLWLYTQNQAKAMALNHFVDKLNMSKAAKQEMKDKLKGWKTPQLKSCFEPIAVAQKPCDGTFLMNMAKYEVGLFNANIKVGENMFPANVISVDPINELIDRCFLVGKPSKKEKGNFNIHQTVKPLALCRHLINLAAFSSEAVILDPFVGSGTTAIAAKQLGKTFIGFDVNPEYVEIANKRLTAKHQGESVLFDQGIDNRALELFPA